ncbi:beta-N-acetylhexosaminidase [Albibacterium bauzanense]|nr:family 20 glycosylhydrolase [Albibacterium bauzanense]
MKLKKTLKTFMALLLILGGSTYSFAQQVETFSIIPKPASIQAKSPVFKLNNQTQIIAKSEDTRKMVSLFNDLIWDRYKIRLAVSSLDAAKNVIILEETTPTNQEEYTLDVNKDQVVIKGGNAGLFYGLQSLLQLIENVDGQLTVPGVLINDKPEFGYRGVMIDVARHFFTLDQMKKIVDQMAYFKFNRLHWHLTDDQGWRLEIKKYPKLTEVSAWRDSTIIGRYSDFKPFIYDGEKHGGYYTQEEAREFVKYAADRKITVIPEIEVPGHNTAVLTAYPELGNGTGPYHVLGYWGVMPTILGPNEATFKFIEDVLTEVMDIFPSELIHIGGDEAPKDEWKASSVAQSFIKKNKIKDEHELQSWFTNRVGEFLNKHGRRLIGWDEILEGGGLAENAIVMSWRGEKGGIAAAQAGHDVIMTPNSYLYIDYLQSKDAASEPLSIGGFVPLDKVYGYNPRPGALTQDEQKHILGVQANLWTEYIATDNKLEYMLFPRMLALSEVAWTGTARQNYDEFTTQRLPERLQELERQHINYRIPEAKVEVGINNISGRKTVTITPFVANSTVYYTIDGHKADNNGTLYKGTFEMPFVGKGQGPLKLNYIIETPGGRASSMFTDSLGVE